MPFLPFIRQDCFLFDNNREIQKRKVIHSRVEKENAVIERLENGRIFPLRRFVRYCLLTHRNASFLSFEGRSGLRKDRNLPRGIFQKAR